MLRLSLSTLYFRFFVISFGRVVVTFPKIVIKTFLGPMRSYPVKENQFGSAVSEILRYKQTDRHPVTLL